MRKNFLRIVLLAGAVAWEVTVNRFATSLPELAFLALWLVPFLGLSAWLITHKRVGSFVYARPMISLALFLIAGAALGGVGWVGWKIVGLADSTAKIDRTSDNPQPTLRRLAAPQAPGDTIHAQIDVGEATVEAKRRQEEESAKRASMFSEMDEFYLTCGGITVKLPRTGTVSLLQFGDSPVVSARLSQGKILVSAKLYAGMGYQPIDVADNKFRLLHGSWDRNFDDSAFEVVNEDREPVLQVVYTTPHNAVIYGLFGPPGKEPWIMSPAGTVYKPPLSDLDRYKLKRIFRYPSMKHPGARDRGTIGSWTAG